MSDPHNDPDASPWTSGGDPVPTAPPPSDQGWQQPSGDPSWGSGQSDGWQQPPPPPGPGGWQQPPPPGQASFGQQPGYSQPPPGYGQPPGFGQQPPFGPPPGGKSSSSKIVWIVLGVVAAIILLVVIAAFAIFNAASDGVSEFVDGIEDLDFSGDAEIPEGPRLLQESGSVTRSNGSARFTFTVPDRTTVQIDVVGQGDFDPVLTLFQEGEQIGRDDDGGSAFYASRLNQELSAGTYEVEITGFGDDTGDFDLIITDL